MDIFGAELIGRLLIFLVTLLLAISAHEAAHAWMSSRYGDETARQLGRVTLNPIAHTDPIGTLLIPIMGFIFGAMGGALASIPLIGWGKPTPVNPRNWTNYKTANVMVSIAGILANLIIAVISLVIIKVLIAANIIQLVEFLPLRGQEPTQNPVVILLSNMLFLNVSLAVFNLLPFPPLDGSKVLSTFLPASMQPTLDLLEQYGFMILILLMYMGVISAIMYPVRIAVYYLLIFGSR
ncbi:MAG TPA: site-2 protease family protein [Pyrinomonadaceae bacterium]|nr:site-2 protease family protein [Pyrinomonadaceae bacterium]